MHPVLQQWFLNLAIDFPVALELLPSVLNGDDRKPNALNVRCLRGFRLEEGVNRLVGLAENGLLEFVRGIEQSKPGMITPSEVLRLMAHGGIEKGLSFRLTPAGGDAWEAAAEPRWHEMHDGFASPRDREGRLLGFDWTLFSQNRERLIAMLGWWPMLQQEDVDVETVAWVLAQDYRVKYWKRLPNVHVVTFQSSLRAPSMAGWKRGLEPRWFTAWRTGAAMWFRHPWDMDGWPPTPGP